jgi:hypothetical protein
MDELCGGKGQWNGLIGQINCAWRRVSYQTMYKLNVAQHHTNRNSYLQQMRDWTSECTRHRRSRSSTSSLTPLHVCASVCLLPPPRSGPPDEPQFLHHTSHSNSFNLNRTLN